MALCFRVKTYATGLTDLVEYVSLNLESALYCVKCASPSLIQEGPKAFKCQRCHFVYFHNVAAAVCAFIVCADQILLVERGQAPCIGKLDFPGGFVDYDESNEQALRRELMEELQLPVENMRYCFSYPNRYLYKDVLYSTLDSFFEIKLATKPKLALQKAELNSATWIRADEFNAELLAFDSGKRALAHYTKS